MTLAKVYSAPERQSVLSGTIHHKTATGALYYVTNFFTCTDLSIFESRSLTTATGADMFNNNRSSTTNIFTSWHCNFEVEGHTFTSVFFPFNLLCGFTICRWLVITCPVLANVNQLVCVCGPGNKPVIAYGPRANTEWKLSICKTIKIHLYLSRTRTTLQQNMKLSDTDM